MCTCACACARACARAHCFKEYNSTNTEHIQPNTMIIKNWNWMNRNEHFVNSNVWIAWFLFLLFYHVSRIIYNRKWVKHPEKEHMDRICSFYWLFRKYYKTNQIAFVTQFQIQYPIWYESLPHLPFSSSRIPSLLASHIVYSISCHNFLFYFANDDNDPINI